MNRDGNRILPYSRREHFFMLYKVNGEAVGIPHTFDQWTIEAARNRLRDSGDLKNAYILHTVLGDGPPTVADVQDAPWWHSYYWTQTTAGCVECGKELVEDRALSVKCQHQACTSCALAKTVSTWDSETTNIPCPACAVRTNYLLFNGEQCPDERSHEVALLFKVV